MAVGLVSDTHLAALGDAIRAKLGTNIQYAPGDMAAAIMSIPTGGSDVEIVPFSSGTDAQIAAMIDAAHNGDIDLQQDGGWSVGDTRSISIGAFSGVYASQPAQNIDIVITSFDEYMNCGNLLQFDFKESLSAQDKMHSTSVNSYSNSAMKNTSIPALVNALPDWLRDRLIEFSVLVSDGNQSSNISTITGNKLALRSEIEVFGTTVQSFDGEGTIIPYYEASNNRIKKLGISGNNANWWLRSPRKTNGTAFCYSNNRGVIDYDSAGNLSGFSPFGCI